MQTVADYTQIYKDKSGKKSAPSKSKGDSTLKWVEIMLDIGDMRSLLIGATIDESFKLLKAMNIAERKQTYHERQESFDYQRAGALLSAIRNGMK